MTYYAAFGGCLHSEIPLPELRELPAAPPDWTVSTTELSAVAAELLGSEGVDTGVSVQCYRIADGVRLAFSDTGTFDITNGGTAISWTPGTASVPNLVRADLLGSVFSVALHLQGLICLHGSGVTINGTAIGFLAQKGTGKSTTAMALCAAGAALITDDILPVDPRPPVAAWPAMPAVRLLDDSATRLQRAESATHDPKSGKYRVTALDDSQVETARAPLVAIYELSAVASAPDTPAANRVRLSGGIGAMTLLRHHKTGTVFGQAESRNLFDRATDIARYVPVYRLEVARDFARLPEVVSQIFAWHSPSEVPAASAAATAP
jgi:hypothetical protein